MYLRSIKIIVLLCFFTGFVLLIKPMYFYSKGYIVQYLLNISWNKCSLKKYHWFNLHPVAKIMIPRLGINDIVLDGSKQSILAFGPGKLEESAHIHEKNKHILIAGHRDTFFKNLKNISKNDEIILEHIEGISKYLVQNTIIIEPYEYEKIINNSINTLTLITCFPFNYIGDAPKRFIVNCKLADN